MPPAKFLKAVGGKVRSKRLSKGGSSSRVAALMPGAQNTQINGGVFTVIGRDVHNHTAQFNLESFLRSLPILNFRRIHSEALSKATAGTGVWILENVWFRAWLEPTGEILIMWGTGMPGAGKTILAFSLIVIRELERHVKGSQGLLVAYAYVRYTEQISVRRILESLLKQLVERDPGSLSIVGEVLAQHYREDTEPAEAELLDILRMLKQSRVAIFYVLDALDEAPTEVQLKLVKKLAGLGIKLFITSRPLKHLESSFPTARIFTIRAQDEDIDLHINEKIEENATLQNLLGQCDASVRAELLSTVKTKAGGMFLHEDPRKPAKNSLGWFSGVLLHASLQLEALQRCLSFRDIKDTLSRFPDRLEDVYQQTWSRISSQDLEHARLAKHLLLWVLYAKHPVTLNLLQYALAICPKTNVFQADRLVAPSSLVSLCQGLVTIDEERNTVQLVHYTARTMIESLILGIFSRPQATLASVCMVHIANRGLLNSPVDFEGDVEHTLRSDPLLWYSYRAWFLHARESLDIESTARQTRLYLAQCLSFPIFSSRPGFKVDFLGPLHVLVFAELPFQLLETGKILLSLNSPSKKLKLTPLGLAVTLENYYMVRDLLQFPGILPNIADVYGVTPLMHACILGNFDLVELLLAQPTIDVNQVDGQQKTALDHSLEKGHLPITQLLLSHLDPSVPDRHGCPALIRASQSGDDAMVKLLLHDPRVDVNLVDTFFGQTALMHACRAGYEGVVKLLLSTKGTITKRRATF
ncbi:hypothetical protein BKA70DRAFT_1561777 [Coprinopsis sp. MPI-PUGE-AT-0042]|nr:hypothetical protein BKA70DRAFT_1561777 [Coprinopsis sp. MPI-PUGE-AT-0042]